MECHVELSIFVKAEPVTEGDTDRLVATAEAYLHATGGTPVIDYRIEDGLLGISVAGMALGKGAKVRGEQLSKDYVRTCITRALAEAGMIS
jgi:hypothetical protein